MTHIVIGRLDDPDRWWLGQLIMEIIKGLIVFHQYFDLKKRKKKIIFITSVNEKCFIGERAPENKILRNVTSFIII